MVELNHALSVRGESSAGTRLIRKTEREINNLINSALPVLAYPVNSIRQCALFCRKGATYLSPGLRRSYPGSAGATQPTLKGLRHCFPRPPFTQPRWGWIFVPSLPRVAAAQQPWADIRSIFRAKKRTAESTGYAKTGRTINSERQSS
uniref:Uncharacterized protein n=1 Tax=Candidatus Kentrum sp. TUN TaxID=2126343 RepID=A0A450ZPJ4_9GAMM|nr:MAG: hypothetical protein BECKTUN1418E_GA0071001_103223 [Candidatus Kentron sp. TUN]